MSAQLPRFGLLAVTGGEGMHFAAPFVGELKRHVSQSADTNDPHTGRGGQVVDQERREDSDAAAKERTGLFQIHRIRQRTNPRPLGSNTIGKAAVASDNGSLSSGTKVLVPGKAFVA